ncbi:MAG TPA: hypothetical protein VK957_21050 [Lunatimonas sp.]|nr:hypothetical protein [Lunatimonas sp.]
MYLLATFLQIAIMLLYFKVADRYNIIDKPNERSSHTGIIIRGGGIVFAGAILLAFFMGYASWQITLAVLMVATVSFVDDVRPLSQIPRFTVHVLASLLVLYEVGLWENALWWIPLVLFVFLGWVNIFNFMDGINGITALYSLAVLVGFYLLPELIEYRELILLVGISVIVFAFFNVRKTAKTFAGDVGSISMAFILGYLMLHLILISGEIHYILFFAVYGIDGVLTILQRLVQKENIFHPHRTHLYQYLANEMRWGHLKVTFLYSSIQLLINVLLIYYINLGFNPSLLSFILIVLAMIVIYFYTKFVILRKINVL